MAKTTVNLQAIRAVLKSEITTLQQVVQEGATAVKSAKIDGRKAMIAKKQKSLSRARKVLRKLKSVESSMEDYCCDQKIQNCEFDF